MDDPELDPGLHRQALRALHRVNRVSGSASRIRRALERLGPEVRRPIRILDVACGGGEVLVSLGRWASRVGIPVELHGCDASPLALAHASEGGDSAGVVLHLHRIDVVAEPLPEGFDLVTSTLFLHHLERPEVVDLLRRLSQVARAGVIQDLIRSPLGYLLAWAGLRLLSRSRVAWVDGPRSVEAGFSVPEVLELSREAGLPRPRVQRVWPERWLLEWGVA